MRLTAVLCHFAESPTMLAACVASLSKLGVDHLVAVDGAYQLYPQGKGSSGVDQTRAITDTAEAIGVGLTLFHLPQAAKFRGNEIEKRQLSLDLARVGSTEDDWLIIVDGDEVVDSVMGDVRSALDATEMDVATYSLVTRIDPQESAEKSFVSDCAGGLDARTPCRGILRCLPGLRYAGNHYTVLDGERVLAQASPLAEPALSLDDMLIVEHRNHLRNRYRAESSHSYYRLRDEHALESVWLKDGERV